MTNKYVFFLEFPFKFSNLSFIYNNILKNQSVTYRRSQIFVHTFTLQGNNQINICIDFKFGKLIINICVVYRYGKWKKSYKKKKHRLRYFLKSFCKLNCNNWY